VLFCVTHSPRKIRFLRERERERLREMGCGNSREKILESENKLLEREAKTLRDELDKSRRDSDTYRNVFDNVFDLDKKQCMLTECLIDFRNEIETFRDDEKSKGMKSDDISNRLCMEIMGDTNLNAVSKRLFELSAASVDVITKQELREFLIFVFFRFNRYMYMSLVEKGKVLQNKLESLNNDAYLEVLGDLCEMWNTNCKPDPKILDLINQSLLKGVDDKTGIGFKEFCNVVAKAFMAQRGEENLAPSWNLAVKKLNIPRTILRILNIHVETAKNKEDE